MTTSLKDKTKLDSGSDHTTYLSEDSTYVIKVYDLMMSKLGKTTGLEKCKDFVTKYNEDTLKAIDILELEWNKRQDFLKMINLDNQIYRIDPIILPQGKLEIIDGLVALVGQQYNPNPNLKKIFKDNNDNENPIYANLFPKREHLRRRLDVISDNIIRSALGVQFVISNNHVTPVIDVSARRIDLLITDLARNILETYSEKKKAVRRY